MPKATEKIEISVTVNIKPVKLAGLLPWQRRLWARFWQTMLSQVNAAEKEPPPSQTPANDTLTGGEKED